MVVTDVQRLEVRGDQLVLAAELLADQLLDLLDGDIEQGRQRADIDDVLEQLPLARVGIGAVDDVGQRHAEHDDVVAELGGRHGPRGIVEQVAARIDGGDVLVPGLGVHRHHHVGAAARAEMAGLGDPDLVPGRQPLNVRGEDVARRDRYAHPHDGAGEELVGAGGTRSVHIGKTDHEVIHALDWHACPA
jgi:hypothetical protein